MKNLLKTRFKQYITGLVFLTVICSSCKNKDEVVPDYAGKWMTDKPVAVATGYVSIKYYIELTSDEFKETFIRPARNSYSNGDQLSLEGSVSASGKILKLVVHKLSISIYNPATGTASAPHETHTYKDQDFGFLFEGMINSIGNYQSEYSLIDGKLTVKVDYNRDGIYAENEKSVYTRQ